MPWSPWPRVDHTVFEGTVAEPEVPETVTSLGWTWESPEEANVVEVGALSTGPLVTVSDGIIALRGDTGEELWRYRRLGERVTDVNVTSDGERVVMAYADGDPDEETGISPQELVLLDASTGAVDGTHTAEFFLGRGSFFPLPRNLDLLSDVGRIDHREEDEGSALVSSDLETGEEMWRISSVEGAGHEGRTLRFENVRTLGGVVVVSGLLMDETIESYDETLVDQDHTFLLLGLDSGTGEELWRHEADLFSNLDLSSSKLGVWPEHEAVAAVARSQGLEWILDPVTGEPLTEEEFFLESDVSVIGAWADGLVTERVLWEERSDLEEREYEYTYTDLSGRAQDTLIVGAPLERPRGSFVRPLEEAIVWLDVNGTEYANAWGALSSWDTALLVVTEKGTDEPLVLDTGIKVERDYEYDGSPDGTLVPDPAFMIAVPGALVIRENLGDGGARHVVGLVP
ncbi:hypothetical protein ACFW4K_18505 [Nocardiopsis alba]|uniref:hypothetical protein n=1 Tax=Nocardiopsis alba TaxID=53437 RepID=UPI00366CEF8B